MRRCQVCTVTSAEMVKLPSFLSTGLTLALFMLPVVMLIATTATWLVGHVSMYFTKGMTSQPLRHVVFRRHALVTAALVYVALIYALLLVPDQSRMNLTAYDALFRHNVFEILGLVGIIRGMARFQTRLNLEQRAVLYALVGALIVAVAMYTNGEPIARIVDAAQYAAMAGATMAVALHVVHVHIAASASSRSRVEHHGYIVRALVTTWEYRHVRRSITRYRSEALAELGFVALRVLAKRQTRPTELLFVAAFDELDGCFKGELERLDCGLPTAQRIDSTALTLYSLYPQCDRACSACGTREPTTRTRCEACGSVLRKNLPNPYAPLGGSEEVRTVTRAASTSCRRRTQLVAGLATLGAVLLAAGSVVPWFLPGARPEISSPPLSKGGPRCSGISG